MAEMIVIDAKSIKSNIQLDIDTKKSEPVPTVILNFPNATTVTIRGDEEIVKQIVERLDGLTVEYTERRQYETLM